MSKYVPCQEIHTYAPCLHHTQLFQEYHGYLGHHWGFKGQLLINQ